MHIQTALEQFGLTPGQVKIYLASLKMGEASIAELASKVNIPRTTVTDLLREMQQNGLVNCYVKRGRKSWSAENPDKLLILAKEREASIQAIIPLLQAMRHSSGEGRPNIRNYFGPQEVRTVFDDIITTRQHFSTLVNWDDICEYFGEEFMENFIERRRTHFLRNRLLTPKTERAITLQKRDSAELRLTRFLPNHIDLRRVSNFIYGGKVIIISMNRKQPIATMIEDPDIFHAMTIYFESLWHYSGE